MGNALSQLNGGLDKYETRQVEISRKKTANVELIAGEAFSLRNCELAWHVEGLIIIYFLKFISHKS